MYRKLRFYRGVFQLNGMYYKKLCKKIYFLRDSTRKITYFFLFRKSGTVVFKKVYNGNS